MKRIISEIVAAVVMLVATVVVAGATMVGFTLAASASWSPWSAKHAYAAAAFSLDPAAVECWRALTPWPICIGPPGRPYADRLCMWNDGAVVSIVFLPRLQTDDEREKEYWQIMHWREEQQRWEQE